MSTVLIAIAVAFLLAGTIIIFASPSGSSKVTIRNEGSIVTVRSAARSDVTVTFDPTGIPGEESPAALVPGSEPFAEDEPTVVEAFTDPKTTMERKREIDRTFDGLKCRFIVEGVPAQPTSASTATKSWEDDGCDEGHVNPNSDEDDN